MNLPKILIIDDQFGQYLDARRDLSAMFSLSDETGDDSQPEPVNNPLARATFCSGQLNSNFFVENSAPVALEAAKKGWPFSDGSRWALVLLDLRFVSGKLDIDGKPVGRSGDDDFGLKILEGLRISFPDLPIVILSSRERTGVIEDCRKLGASDFIQRHPAIEGSSPREILASKLHEFGLLEDQRKIIVGRSLSLLKALASARRAATGEGNILLRGETGTGKELFARYIHDVSPKSNGPYNPFETSHISDTLMEATLFGHERGAFTGAISSESGIFEATNEGTLFIDELSDIPMSVQSKFLRSIESRRIKRLGGKKEITLDVQIVLATNKNLDKSVTAGGFRQDLLNRVRAYTITLPPLRERKEDIPLIASHLLENLCKENSARWPRKILSETMELLIGNDWPDNVRGLRNVLERAVKNNKDSELLVPPDLKFESQPHHMLVTKQKSLPRTNTSKDISLDDLIKEITNFHFPNDYSILQGRLPSLQQAIARLFANYLSSAIEISKKRRPGAIDGELNLTGAASCMMGKQLRTPKAADLIKKLLQQDKAVLEELLQEYPVLHKAYEEVLRRRPKDPNKTKSSKRG